MRKSNESFSGKGHAAHICKVCSRLSPAQQAEQMTLRRLENLPLHRLTESEMTWLKNRTHDHRPDVKSLACMVYAERFPHLARNRKKQELSIQTLTLSIDGGICDSYGEPVYVKESYQVSRTPSAIIRTQQDGTLQVMEPPPKILAKLLKWTTHTGDFLVGRGLLRSCRCLAGERASFVERSCGILQRGGPKYELGG